MYKRIPTMQQKKLKPIFTDASYLGLSDNIEYENFFRSMCDENFSIKYARLNRNQFKQFLQDRYSKVVGEKICIFLENQFATLYRIDYNSFINIILDFINAGPEMHKKLVFACLSITNTGRICEHDLN